MSSILLLLLKFVAVALISVLAFFLVMLLLLLFVPFTYKAAVKKNSAITGTASISWLFGILSVSAALSNKNRIRIAFKLFGATLFKTKPPAKEDASVTTPADTKPHTPTDEPPTNSEPPSNTPQTGAPPKHEKPPEPPTTKPKPKPEPKPKPKKFKLKKQEKSTKPPPPTDNANAFAKIKKVLDYENKREILNQALLLLKRLLKAVTNLRITADITFGTGEPDTTGIILGAIYAAQGALSPSKLSVTAAPDFDRKTISGTAAIKGKLLICSVLWAILLFIFNKNIFPLLKQILFKKEKKQCQA